MELSNFYKDFSFKPEHFEALLKVYSDLLYTSNLYIEQSRRNTVIPDIETYRIFPFQRLVADSATYTLTEILDDTRIIKKLGLENFTINQRISQWVGNYITVDQKVIALDILNLYIPLTAKRGLPHEKDYSVIDFSFFDGETRLKRNTDYVLNLNKIYLLGSAGVKTQGKYLHMTDIAVDLNSTEDLLGKFIDLAYNDALTKNEYNEISKMLLAASLGGPTILNLKTAIQSLPGFEGADLFDKYVLDPQKQKRWLKPNYTDFDFVVVLPEAYAAYTEKLRIMIEYLRMVKPAYTKFFVILQSLYSDLYNIAQKANDADNLDIIHELEEDVVTGVYEDSEISDFILGTDSDIYTFPTATSLNSSFLNGPDRLNLDFLTFGFDSENFGDPHFDYLFESSEEVYTGILEEDEFTLIEIPSEESYNNSDDAFAQTTITDTRPHYRLNGPQMLNIDMMTDRIIDTTVLDY